jgi:hypothetical protein
VVIAAPRRFSLGFKRYFEPSALLEELGGVGEVLLTGDWFVVVRSVR